MGLFSGVLNAFTGGIGGTLAGIAGDALFSKDSPTPASAQDFSKNFQSVLGGINNTPTLSKQYDYGTIPGQKRQLDPTQAAQAGDLQQFTSPQMSAQALQNAFGSYNQMAQTGFGSAEMEKLSNEQFGLAQQRSQQSFQDQLGSLDNFLASRGMGQSGVGAGQARELAQRSTLDLSTLANQIAQNNSQQQRAYQLQGIQGAAGIGNQAYQQGANTFGMNQSAQQQNFNQQLQSANQASQFFGENQNLNQQTYENALRAQQMNNSQDQFLDQLNVSQDSLRFGTASNVMGGASAQQNAAFGNEMQNVNSYNTGLGSLFGNTGNSGLSNQMQAVNTQQQNFLNQLQGGNSFNDLLNDYNNFDFNLDF